MLWLYVLYDIIKFVIIELKGWVTWMIRIENFKVREDIDDNELIKRVCKKNKCS